MKMNLEKGKEIKNGDIIYDKDHWTIDRTWLKYYEENMIPFDIHVFDEKINSWMNMWEGDLKGKVAKIILEPWIPIKKEELPDEFILCNYEEQVKFLKKDVTDELIKIWAYNDLGYKNLDGECKDFRIYKK